MPVEILTSIIMDELQFSYLGQEEHEEEHDDFHDDDEENIQNGR